MFDIGERNPVLGGIGLHEFETHAATRQLVERIVAVGALGIENGYGRRNLLGRKMVVADDEIHALLLRINNLFHGFDTAIEGYGQRHALAGGVVDALDRYAVTVVITVGDVENEVRVTYLPQKLVDQRDGRGAVHIVIAVNHDLLIGCHGSFDALHRLRHIGHQIWVVQVGELRIKEFVGLFYGVYASLYK